MQAVHLSARSRGRLPDHAYRGGVWQHRALRFFDPDAIDVMRGVQPFHNAGHALPRPLKLLQAMSNADKHRLLRMSWAKIQLHDLRMQANRPVDLSTGSLTADGASIRVDATTPIFSLPGPPELQIVVLPPPVALSFRCRRWRRPSSCVQIRCPSCVRRSHPWWRALLDSFDLSTYRAIHLVDYTSIAESCGIGEEEEASSSAASTAPPSDDPERLAQRSSDDRFALAKGVAAAPYFFVVRCRGATDPTDWIHADLAS